MDYNKIADSLLKDDAYYELNATELMNAEALKKRDRLETIEVIENEQLPKIVSRGFDLVLQDIEKILEEKEYKELIEDLSRVPERQQKQKDNDEIITLQQFFGLSDETLRKVYALGYDYFANGNYDYAIDILLTLTTLNPYLSDFWYTLACCYRAKKEEKEELKCFKVATAANPENIPAQLMLIECLLEQQLPDEARARHEQLKQVVIDNPKLEKEWGKTVNHLLR